MVKPTSADVLQALLALDSYNEGYDRGLAHSVTKIGSATWITDSTIKLGLLATSAACFYAAAYRLDDGTTVIAHRRTDNTSIFDTTSGDPQGRGSGEAARSCRRFPFQRWQLQFKGPRGFWRRHRLNVCQDSLRPPAVEPSNPRRQCQDARND
jgi:hypothetical protein